MKEYIESTSNPDFPGVKFKLGNILAIFSKDDKCVSDEFLDEINAEIKKSKEFPIYADHVMIVELVPEIKGWEPASEEFRVYFDEEMLLSLKIHCRLSLPPKTGKPPFDTQRYHLIILNYGEDLTYNLGEEGVFASILDLNPHRDKSLKELMELANSILPPELLPIPYSIPKEKDT